MTFDGITVNHARLQNASTDLGTAARQIRTRLDTLEADLAPLAEAWSGQAKQSYATARATWDAAIGEMVLLLQQVAAAVDESNEAYRTADQRGAQRFA